MTTARDIIKKAMQKIGVLVKQEDPSADEVNDALSSLNAMLSSWSNRSLLVYARVWESFPLVANQSDYTIGTGGNFNTTRPIFINECHVRQGSTDYSVQVIDDNAYNAIAFKNLSGIPEFVNFDNAFPLAKLRFYLVPTGGLTFYMSSEKELSQFTLDDTVNLPAGWERALIYNLAMEIAPEYGLQISPDLRDTADKALDSIVNNVARIKTMDYINNSTTANIYSGYR
jgi:hypothetical protein